MDVWPLEQLWPSSVVWRRALVKRGGDNTMSLVNIGGTTDAGGRWVCEMTVPLLDVQQIKQARAMVEGTDGGTVPLIVPYLNEADAPYPYGVPAESVPFGDGSTFGDGTEFAGSAINVEAAAADLRATLLGINIIASAALVGGEFFSISHPTFLKRLYTVVRVPASNQIKIRPPLREAIPDETPLDFERPGCVMNLTSAEESIQPVTAGAYMSSLNLQFIEELDV